MAAGLSMPRYFLVPKARKDLVWDPRVLVHIGLHGM